MTGIDVYVDCYNSDGVDTLRDRAAPGASPRLTQAQWTELRRLVIAGPDLDMDKVMRWRCLDLREQVAQRFEKHSGEAGVWLFMGRL